jgi:hypothetical protein
VIWLLVWIEEAGQKKNCGIRIKQPVTINNKHLVERFAPHKVAVQKDNNTVY